MRKLLATGTFSDGFNGILTLNYYRDNDTNIITEGYGRSNAT
jgi:hypothetical protein